MSDPFSGRPTDDGIVAFPILKPNAGHDQNMIMYLGLFLLLLVFFILLSTMAKQRDDRVLVTAGSLAATFGRVAWSEDGRPGELIPGSTQEVVADRVGRLMEEWSRRLPIEGARRGERIQFSLPVSAVFSQSDGAALQPEAEAFLADLVSLIRAAPSGSEMAVDAVIGSTIIGAWSPGASPPLPISRAGSLARFLTQAGLGSATLTVGVEVVNAPSVRFIVRVNESVGSNERH